jgi:hypothetical protein
VQSALSLLLKAMPLPLGIAALLFFIASRTDARFARVPTAIQFSRVSAMGQPKRPLGRRGAGIVAHAATLTLPIGRLLAESNR